MANFNFNKVIIGGRLTADPELKTTPAGVAVTSFVVAVNRRHQAKDAKETQADFITVTAWRQTAEFVTRFFRKASSICIVGSIQTRSWTDQQGQKRYATEVVADEAYFVDAKGVGSEPAAAAGAQTSEPYVPEQYQTPPHFEDLGDNEELPF
jgi:single-strand DNA-binding protein